MTGFDFSDMTKSLVERRVASPASRSTRTRRTATRISRAATIRRWRTRCSRAHAVAWRSIIPDYHGVGDEWQKIDYANMAKVDRAVAVALLDLASDAPPPQWNASNPKTKAYVEAAAKLHPKID